MLISFNNRNVIMLAKTWSEVLIESLQNFWFGVVDFAPKLILAVVVFIIGWLVAELIKRGIVHLFEALKVDKLLSQTGLEKVIERAGYKLNAGLFIGWLVKWFLIIAFLIPSLEIIGLTQVNGFLTNDVLGFLPQVFVAALVLLVASVVADLLEKVVVGSARAANIQSAKMLGTVARWSVWVFAILAALWHLGIAGRLIETLFVGFVAMLALAGGLAFGLGGKDTAGEVVKKMKDQLSHK